jgi:hypothetical protein
LDPLLFSDADKLSLEVEESVRKGISMKEALLKAIRKSSKVVSKGALARGKNKKATGDVTMENAVESKRKRQKVMKFDRILPDKTGTSIKNKFGKNLKSGELGTLKSGESEKTVVQTSTNKKADLRKGKGKQVAKVGDLISVAPEIFDGQSGSYSKENPDRIFGTVNSITKNGIANITWVDDGSSNNCKLRDLTVVKSKRDVKSVVAGIIAFLVKGKPIKKKNHSDFPKDFFEVLVQEDWRKWV